MEDDVWESPASEAICLLRKTSLSISFDSSLLSGVFFISLTVTASASVLGMSVCPPICGIIFTVISQEETLREGVSYKS